MKQLLISLIFLFTNICLGQTFILNSDGTADTMTFKEQKTAHELFESTHNWAYKYYIFPDKVISRTEVDKKITIIASAFDVLPEKNYRAEYQITLKFYDGYYTIDYSHIRFVLEEEALDYPLTMITKNPQSSSKTKYELSIDKILKDLNYYIINNHSPETTRQ